MKSRSATAEPERESGVIRAQFLFSSVVDDGWGSLSKSGLLHRHLLADVSIGGRLSPVGTPSAGQTLEGAQLLGQVRPADEPQPAAEESDDPLHGKDQLAARAVPRRDSNRVRPADLVELVAGPAASGDQRLEGAGDHGGIEVVFGVRDRQLLCGSRSKPAKAPACDRRSAGCVSRAVLPSMPRSVAARLGPRAAIKSRRISISFRRSATA